jgi:toxin YoeB
MRNIVFTSNSYTDFIEWSQTDKKVFARIDELIKSIRRAPFAGIGKPEPLKHGLAGFWSRRINEKHHLVYRLNDADEVEIASCKNHYSNKKSFQ